MGHHRRARTAVIGATVLATVLATGTTAIGAAGASTRTGAAAPVATSGRVVATLGISIQGQTVRLSVTGVASATEADLHIGIAGTSVEVRRIGPTLYIHVPPGTKAAHLPAGKSWGSVSLQAFASQAGIPLPGLGSPGHVGILSPGTGLAALSGLTAGPFRKVGTATIHKTATTAYVATVDLAKVTRSVPASQTAVLRQLFGSAKLPSAPLTVWVDASGRIVQIRSGFPISANLFGTKLSLKLDLLVQNWDFGLPVHVVAPPASQVAPIPASALKSSALGSAGLGSLGLG